MPCAPCAQARAVTQSLLLDSGIVCDVELALIAISALFVILNRPHQSKHFIGFYVHKMIYLRMKKAVEILLAQARAVAKKAEADRT